MIFVYNLVSIFKSRNKRVHWFYITIFVDALVLASCYTWCFQGKRYYYYCSYL